MVVLNKPITCKNESYAPSNIPLLSIAFCMIRYKVENNNCKVLQWNCI